MPALINSESDQRKTINIKDIPSMPPPKGVFMVEPTHFDIVDTLNVHMQSQDGGMNTIDKNVAWSQWDALKEAYLDINFEVKVIKGKENAADMVFCANQSLPFIDQHGRKAAILSHMRHPSRQVEVMDIGVALESYGYQVHALPESVEAFEGMGDALWVLGRQLILGGYGFRTDRSAYNFVVEQTNAQVVLFELKNPKFYHLDTCLSIINDETVIACSEGFTQNGWDYLKKLFPTVIEVSTDEADSPAFACNAHCPDGKHVIIQKGCEQTNKKIEEEGFKVITVDTSEFIKSGGSVFCMKQILF